MRMLVGRETQPVRAQFNRNRIAEIEGIARFLDPHTVEVTNGEGATTVRADYILIACGTRPARSRSIPLDGHRAVDTDQLPALSDLPRKIIVVG